MRSSDEAIAPGVHHEDPARRIVVEHLQKETSSYAGRARQVEREGMRILKNAAA